MERITEETNIEMYKRGFTEWKEKCLILSKAEQICILHDIKDGKQSDLVDLAKLPFPQFAQLYFRKFKEAAAFIQDPEFGYKLFFLTDSSLKLFSEHMRNPDIPVTTIQELYNIQYDRNEIQYIMGMRLEEIPKTGSAIKANRTFERKFAYLTQYINLEEAKRMNLAVLPIFILDGTDGYEFDNKLASLNTAADRIMRMYIGLGGIDAKPIKTIAKELELSETLVKNLVDILFPFMLRPLGDFRHKIGYEEERQVEGSSKEYTNSHYKTLDIQVETSYILNNILTEHERETVVQTAKTPKKITIYIARKFMFTSAAQTARNLALTTSEVEIITDERRQAF